MLYLKKYFTEGLIQVAILLSLCGVRVDVGPDLPPSLHQIILGPTSALTQAQFHNPHPKSVDLDGFFATRRLLGWVRSLDRLQVPEAELETWLVQREPDPLPLDQSPWLQRAPAGPERDRSDPTHEPGAGPVTAQEDVEADDKETSVSLQECLRLLEETFPFAEEQQLSDVDGRQTHLDREPPLPPFTPADNPSSDLELQWQDLFAVMEPQSTDDAMMTSFDHALESRPPGTLWGVGSEGLHQNRDDNSVTEADQMAHSMDAPLRPGVSGSLSRELVLLPLTPSAQLDDHGSAFSTGDGLENPRVKTSHGPPDHSNLLEEDRSEDFRVGQNAEDDLSAFSMNLATRDLVDDTEDSLQDPEDLARFDVNFPLQHLTHSTSAASQEGPGVTQDLLTTPSSVFLVDEEDVEDEGGLPSPLSDLLEDAAILDEMRLLDLALEEGFGPEIAARLEEEGYLDCETAKQDISRDHDGSVSSTAEDQSEPRRNQQDGDNAADSDSGLSLDFSHSPASPCASEASYYSSSSSSSSSTSSLSCVSAGESPFYENEDEDDDNAEEGLVGSDMEVEVTIKQEEPEEEEMGAVGGGYPEDPIKLFPGNYGDHKLFNGFPWLEHIDHDHTYNQHWSSTPSEMPTKHATSSPQHLNPRHHHRSSSRLISEASMWSRDERRARTLKIPFSNEVIVNLPVEKFNELLTKYQLSEEQLILIRDIRRRGKNKIAAQNCRQRKLDVLLGLGEEVSGLRRRRLRLLREKQDALRNLQEMERRLSVLHQQVFSRLRDEEGRPLDAGEHLLHFGPDGSVAVTSRQRAASLRLAGEKTSKKQRSKKK